MEERFMETKNQAGLSSWSSRPNFRPRQLLTAEQLNASLEDELMRQRLLNRAVHGYGVVVGLGLAVRADGVLDVDRGCLELTGGLALDRHGRMLYWKGGRLGMDDIVGQRPDHEGEYTLCAHFACRPPLDDDCLPFAGEQTQWWKEGVAFTLRRGCHEIDRDCAEHPAGACIGHDQYLCRRTGSLPGQDAENVPVSGDVDWVLADPGVLSSTGFDDWSYDPDPEVCVPIACVDIGDEADHEAEPDCKPRYGFRLTAPRACRVRPFVYRNPLLYELVNGCDVELSRVQEISWQDWIDRGRKEIPWSDFAGRMTTPSGGFAIQFTRPIQADTIHSASVFLAALTQERNSDYWVSHRVPMDLQLVGELGTVASGVRLLPDSDWLAAEVTGRRSSLFAGARFELTIRGQLLRDECGQMLDARPVDIQRGARGQARPGGDFVSAFRVGRRRPDPYGPAQSPGHDDANGEEADNEQPDPETPPYGQPAESR
jgi:hypothetical protein